MYKRIPSSEMGLNETCMRKPLKSKPLSGNLIEVYETGVCVKWGISAK